MADSELTWRDGRRRGGRLETMWEGARDLRETGGKGKKLEMSQRQTSGRVLMEVGPTHVAYLPTWTRCRARLYLSLHIHLARILEHFHPRPPNRPPKRA
jgi:hypothetical protein